MGIVTSRDMRFENHVDARVDTIMTTKENLVTVEPGVDQDTVRNLLRKHRIERVLVVGDDFTYKA